MTKRKIAMGYRFHLNNPALIVKAIRGCAAVDGIANVDFGPVQINCDDAEFSDLTHPIVWIALLRKGRRIAMIKMDRLNRTFVDVF